MSILEHVHGSLLIVRPPVPATVNKAGANYKSEIKHLEYSPRKAYDEWLNICDAIVGFGGDAIFQFEELDTPYLDVGNLVVNGDGFIQVEGSADSIGHIDDVMTGRVFTANGPWVTLHEHTLRAAMPNMLAHRRSEAPYYTNLLENIADATKTDLEFHQNPHRWEGMADVAVVGDQVVLTYAVPGHYDEGIEPKSKRSSREGVSFAADVAGVPEKKRIYAELVYPHFHGDTVHFSARSPNVSDRLFHYPGGLYDNQSTEVATRLGNDHLCIISKQDAVDAYAGNSRQVSGGVLIPDGASEHFETSLSSIALGTKRVDLYELFGKAGGGPACATLYLPDNIELPTHSPLRYSQNRDNAIKRKQSLAETLSVSPEYFEGKRRG